MFADDFEGTPVGGPLLYWWTNGPVQCVEHRGSRWARLLGVSYARAKLPASAVGLRRFRLTLEVVALEPTPQYPQPRVTVAMVGPGVGFAVEASASPPHWTVWAGKQPGVPVSHKDPRGAPHALEARWDRGQWECLWDGETVCVSADPAPAATTDFRVSMSSHYPSSDARFDLVYLDRLAFGGVALAADPNSVTRLVTRQVSWSSDGVFGATAIGSGGYGAETRVFGHGGPAVAALPDGSRVVATAYTPTGTWAGRGRALGVYGGDGNMQMAGHTRPALCALGERGEVLLVTHYYGALGLTRGRLGSGGLVWDTGGMAAIVPAGVGEATPALCALPDGRLLLCYQTLDSQVVQIESLDGGTTWG